MRSVGATKNLVRLKLAIGVEEVASLRCGYFKKREARLLGVWPLATERDGRLSGSRNPVGAVKEAAREAAH
jgi:hypothetical protein